MATYQVHFTKSNQTIPVSDTEYILEAALRQGVRLRFSCQTGSCTTCRVKAHGPIDQSEAMAITDDEVEEGWALICVGRALGDLEIEA